MSIDLTKKATLATLVDTMLNEARTYLGHLQVVALDKADPSLRPYTRNLTPVFLITMTTSIKQFFSREEEKANEKKEKDKEQRAINLSFLNHIITVTTAIYSKLQADNAKKALNLSEKYDSAAHVLQMSYHRDLRSLKNPIAKISDNVWKLTQTMKEIDTLRSSEATSYQHCLYAAAGSSVVFSIGVYAMNPLMQAGGKVVFAFAVLFGGYTFYSHIGDHEKIKNYYNEISEAGERIRRNLQHYNDDMTTNLNLGRVINYPVLHAQKGAR